MNKFHIGAILLLAVGVFYSTVNMSCSSHTSTDTSTAGAGDVHDTVSTTVSTGSGEGTGADHGVCYDEAVEGFVTLPDGSIREVPVPQLCDPHATDLGRPSDVVSSPAPDVTESVPVESNK